MLCRSRYRRNRDLTGFHLIHQLFSNIVDIFAQVVPLGLVLFSIIMDRTDRNINIKVIKQLRLIYSVPIPLSRHAVVPTRDECQ